MARNTPMRALRKRSPRALPLTAVYTVAPEGGYVAEVLEAVGVHTQGDTIEEARANLVEVIALMLEEAPHQFRRRRAKVPPGVLTERMFVVRSAVPREAP